MALQQQEMEEKVKKYTQKDTSSREMKTNADTLIIDSESCSSSEYSDDETSQSESDSSSSSECKKRQKTFTAANHSKRYLEEFPSCESSSVETVIRNDSSDMNSRGAAMQQLTSENSSNLVESKPNEGLANNQNQYSETSKSSRTTTYNTQTVQNKNVPNLQPNVTSTTCDNNNPCRKLDPEYRKYMVSVSKSEGNINEAECELLLEWFFDRFRICDTLDKLQFGNEPITLHKGRLWIACWNETTLTWIMDNIKEYPETYDVEMLNQEISCEVVIPMASNNKNLLDIFDLLEKQNANLITTRWCVVNRKLLESENKNAAVCRNELFSIHIDSESKDILLKNNLKLKYFFWQIMFKFL
ncbi:uncharacterized protein LOC133335283 [Musca vetustissima]|uniref:uncharacterized protein LOC133335283 n=1 Tax=Musca vetustissima TaxID=27455 RepID=UPI002AB70C18|nr:uncharacterized protein LOC133335283 [Musca vetustissima]